MKIILAGGGTAGHVNPAIAIGNYIRKMEASEVYLSGGEGNIEERLAEKNGMEIFTFPLLGIKRQITPQAIKHNVNALSQSAKAARESEKIIDRIKPDIVIGTGGYASVPMVRAAAKKRIKTAVLEINAYPGIATKTLYKRVDCLMLSYAECVKKLPGAKKTVVTGVPVREEILRIGSVREHSWFNNSLPTVLCFWGSVGAKFMNEKMCDFIKLCAEEKKINLIYACGKNSMQWMPDKLKEMGVELSNCDNIIFQEYIYEMDKALSQASLVISRSGGTTAELCAAGRAGILVPSPYAAENHQEKNARILEKSGAAIVVTEKEATGQGLYELSIKTINSPDKIAIMEESARKRAVPDALAKIYDTIREICS